MKLLAWLAPADVVTVRAEKKAGGAALPPPRPPPHACYFTVSVALPVTLALLPARSLPVTTMR